MVLLDSLAPVLEIDGARFFYVYSSVVFAASLSFVVLPLISQFLPIFVLAHTSALRVDLRQVLPGKVLTAIWRGIPVFIRNRTSAEIEASRRTKLNSLKDRLARNANLNTQALAFDVNRCVSRHGENWLVLLGPCTHLGCIPEAKSYGWYCACHGSVYDLAGRVLRGPAPTNLVVPRCVLKIPVLIVGD